MARSNRLAPPVNARLPGIMFAYPKQAEFTRPVPKSKIYGYAKREGALAPLPADLAGWAPQINRLIDAVFRDAQLPAIEDERKVKANPLNENFHKKEFQDLWGRIHRKAAYTVHFETGRDGGWVGAAAGADWISGDAANKRGRPKGDAGAARADDAPVGSEQECKKCAGLEDCVYSCEERDWGEGEDAFPHGINGLRVGSFRRNWVLGLGVR